MSGSSSPPTYPPSLITFYTIAFEGSSVACVLYGVYLTLSGTNLALLQKKRYKILLSYTLLQLTLTTVYFVVSLYAAPAQILAIFGIGSTDGPNALSTWPMIVVNAAFVSNTWTSDAFLLYRCYVVCMGNTLALALPFTLYLATLGSSLAWLVVSSQPGGTYSTHAVQIAGHAYWTCSAATNVCASSLISIRFWLHRRALTRAIGSRQGAFYLGYMAMTLESAVLYTAFAVVALVAFSVESPLVNVFFPVLGMVQSIAPALIISRIARGISLETDGRGSGVTDSLRFSMSRPVGRTIDQDFFDTSGTMRASSGESVKIDGDGSRSFIQSVKEESSV